MSHGESMISSLKNNRRPKRSRFNYQLVEGDPSEGWKKVLKQKATFKQLEEIRLKSVNENEKERYKKRMILVLSVLIFGLLFSLLFLFL